MLILDLETDERLAMLRLIENRIHDMGREIRHAGDDARHDGLLAEQAMLMRLADRLRPMVLEEALC
jgi:hypothetical protein